MKKRYLNTIATGTLESHDCYDKIKHLDYIELESENYKGVFLINAYSVDDDKNIITSLGCVESHERAKEHSLMLLELTAKNYGLYDPMTNTETKKWLESKKYNPSKYSK